DQDRAAVTVSRFGFARDPLDDGSGQPDRQQSLLKTIVVESFAKAWRDHRANPAPQQRGDRMFARRPAAEIIPGEQDGRSAIARLIEHEIGTFLSVRADAPRLEGVIAQARLVAGRHMLDPNDHIGVDVRLEQGGGDTRQAIEGAHGQICLTSTIAPATAAAAAMAGLVRWVRAPGP